MIKNDVFFCDGKRWCLLPHGKLLLPHDFSAEPISSESPFKAFLASTGDVLALLKESYLPNEYPFENAFSLSSAIGEMDDVIYFFLGGVIEDLMTSRSMNLELLGKRLLASVKKRQESNNGRMVLGCDEIDKELKSELDEVFSGDGQKLISQTLRDTDTKFILKLPKFDSYHFSIGQREEVEDQVHS